MTYLPGGTTFTVADFYFGIIDIRYWRLMAAAAAFQHVQGHYLDDQFRLFIFFFHCQGLSFLTGPVIDLIIRLRILRTKVGFSLKTCVRKTEKAVYNYNNKITHRKLWQGKVLRQHPLEVRDYKKDYCPRQKARNRCRRFFINDGSSACSGDKPHSSGLF